MPATNAVAERERRGVGGATAERIRHSGEPPIVIADVQRLEDWPLRQMHRRGVISDRLHHIGKTLYGYHAGGNLGGVAPQSFMPRVDGTGALSEPQAKRIAENRAAYAKAICVVSGKVQQVVVMMVINEVGAAETGMRVFGREDETGARAVAIEFLKEGLDTIGKAWGM